jgi:hypothetical protein
MTDSDLLEAQCARCAKAVDSAEALMLLQAPWGVVPPQLPPHSLQVSQGERPRRPLLWGQGRVLKMMTRQIQGSHCYREIQFCNCSVIRLVCPRYFGTDTSLHRGPFAHLGRSPSNLRAFVQLKELAKQNYSILVSANLWHVDGLAIGHHRQ